MKAFWRCGLFLFNFIFFLYYIFSNVHDINVAMILLWISSHFINKIYWFFNSCLSFFFFLLLVTKCFMLSKVMMSFGLLLIYQLLIFSARRNVFYWLFMLSGLLIVESLCIQVSHLSTFFFFPPVMNGSPCTETIFNETWPVSKGSTMKGFFN